MYRIKIIIPIYNDNISLSKILNEIDKIKSEKYIFNITLIDDFSDKPIFDSLSFNYYKNINSIKILRLHTNMGHQKAISVGLYDAINGILNLYLLWMVMVSIVLTILLIF